MTDQDVRTLTGGVAMPVLGLGVWQSPPGQVTEQAVAWALEAGYRHIDTAQAYRNEAGVGAALAASGIPREEVFVTTKFRPRAGDPVAEAERSLKRLGIDQLDLYLVHWPAGGPTRAWAGMQRALEQGLTRAIGVSNFSVAELDAVFDMGGPPPSVNQVEFHPFAYRKALLESCEERGVVLEAYSPLGTGRHLDDPTVVEVAKRVGRTPAQVLIRWALQHDTVVIPKSVHQERIVENLAVSDFTLDDEAMATLDALDRTGGTTEAREDKWW
jgi:diketogulonate reductase-like aldo/keto reductase